MTRSMKQVIGTEVTIPENSVANNECGLGTSALIAFVMCGQIRCSSRPFIQIVIDLLYSAGDTARSIHSIKD